MSCLQASAVSVYYLHVKGSIDDIIWASLENKLEEVGQVRRNTAHCLSRPPTCRQAATTWRGNEACSSPAASIRHTAAWPHKPQISRSFTPCAACIHIRSVVQVLNGQQEAFEMQHSQQQALPGQGRLDRFLTQSQAPESDMPPHRPQQAVAGLAAVPIRALADARQTSMRSFMPGAARPQHMGSSGHQHMQSGSGARRAVPQQRPQSGPMEQLPDPKRRKLH